MKTKYKLCQLLDMFFNLRLDRRLTELLIILRNQMSGAFPSPSSTTNDHPSIDDDATRQ